MKKILLSLSVIMMCLSTAAQTIDTEKLSPYDKNAPFGWGEGITGGGTDGTVVTVETKSQLDAVMTSFDSSQKIIYINGTINFEGLKEYLGVKNKTIIGLPGATLQNLTETEEVAKTGILYLKNCENIIIRNLTFKSSGAYDIDGNDNLWLTGCTKIWVDHCDFQDGVDGNFDCTDGSDKICVTWCRFRYLKEPKSGGSGGSNDHRFSNLWGGSDSRTTDNNKLNTTFANCWWDNGCKERMPRVRYGKVHILNCLYSSNAATNTGYCIGGGYKSNVYSEKCAFISQKYAWKNQATKTNYMDYNITFTDCLGQGNFQDRYGSNDYFVPSYTYDSYSKDNVQSVVSNSDNGAGPTLKFKNSTGITQVENGVINHSDAPMYNLSGQRVYKNYKGIVIINGKKVFQTR